MASIDDIEDGEIVSDEDCNDEKTNSNQTENPFGNYEMIGRNPPNSANFGAGQQFKTVRAQDIHYSSDEESQSESDDDSSPRKKKPMNLKPKPNITGAGGHRMDNTWVQDKHQSIINQPGPKKRNNVWGSVLQEENMSNFVDQLNRNEEVDYNARGAESYDWTRSKLDPRYKKDYEEDESDESSDSDGSEDNTNDAPSDLTNMETFAASTVKGKLSVKQRLGKRVEKKRDSIDSNKSNRSELSNHSCDDFESEEEIQDAREKIKGNMDDINETIDQDKPRDAREIIKSKSVSSKPAMAINPYDKVDYNDLIKQAQDRLKNKKSTPESMDADENGTENKHSKFDARDKIKNRKSTLDARDIIKNKKLSSENSSQQADAREKLNERKRTHNRQRDKNTFEKGKRNFKRYPYAPMDVELKPMKIGVDVSSTMDTLLLADTVSDALQEPQDKLNVFIRIIEELGAEKCVKIFKATEDVEEMGGLMIQNGLRRRTPGGVFFFLIRNDCDVTSEQLTTIFGEQAKEFKQQCNRERRNRKKHARAKKREEEARLKAADSMETQERAEEADVGRNPVSNENKDDGIIQDDTLDLEEPGLDIELA